MRLEKEARVLRESAMRMLEMERGKPESARAISDIAQRLEDLAYELGAYV